MHYQHKNRQSKVKQVSKMHELRDPIEQQRILNAGFTILNNNNCLRVYNPLNKSCGINMTRSVGDFMYKMNLRSNEVDPNNNALSNEPEIVQFDLSTENKSIDMILMGCDGIWDGTVMQE